MKEEKRKTCRHDEKGIVRQNSLRIYWLADVEIQYMNPPKWEKTKKVMAAGYRVGFEENVY